LLCGAEVRPDPPESMERLQIQPHHVVVVVPEQRALDRRPISDRGSAADESENDRKPLDWLRLSLLGILGPGRELPDHREDDDIASEAVTDLMVHDHRVWHRR
jgi:hypothetical protein